ncbi:MULTISPECIES: hypothetical protein [unclassified Rhizobium]|uniref:hypothetical protein n=1 Tax=unclassified Rhizobium TaxID=2613769 RepID=UPI001B1B7876|nr:MULTISPECIES: hypothetical protein [unclassified Rhizobium]MBO9099650.1 hypothetical protein [Rhizobium sp. L58/93]QXZ82365.1 hypothetical protein J5287_09590 [Rhizobium sp. K1/93]
MFFTIATVLSTAAITIPTNHAPNMSSIQTAAICFKTGEQTSGMKKICYYDCLGSTTAITIGAVELCPLSIND